MSGIPIPIPSGAPSAAAAAFSAAASAAFRSFFARRSASFSSFFFARSASALRRFCSSFRSFSRRFASAASVLATQRGQLYSASGAPSSASASITACAFGSHVACTQKSHESHPTIAGQFAHCQTTSHTGQNWPSLCSFAHRRHLRDVSPAPDPADVLEPEAFSSGTPQLEQHDAGSGPRSSAPSSPPSPPSARSFS